MPQWNPSHVGIFCALFDREWPHVRATDLVALGRPFGELPHDHGPFYSFVLPFKRATFNMILDRCKLSQRILDLKEHRAVASHSADYVVQDDESGSVDIQSLLHVLLSSFVVSLR